ncbi:MAG: light-harvesting protein [Betaproteobacteria bacterium]|jgi:light-harvesting protein B-800-850 alpha chain
MIYGKMWLVVKPSVGVPLFLGACAVGSFSVHYALLTHTTWVKEFLNGHRAAPVVAAEAPAVEPPSPPSAKK